MKRFKFLIITVSIITMQYVATQAQGMIYGCYKPNHGNLRIVSGENQCSQNEIPINWNSQGQQGATGPQGPSGPAGPGGFSLRVVDSNQQLVGYVFDHYHVVRQFGSYWVSFRVDVPYGLSESLPSFLYTTTDCSGQEYNNAPPGAVRQASRLGANFYFGGDPYQNRVMRSYRGNTGSAMGPCQSIDPPGQTQMSSPVIQVPVPVFSGPFTTELVP